MFLYIIPAIFSGPLATLIGDNPLAQAARVLPTYYIANGAYDAMQNQGSPGSHLFNITIILGTTLALIAITAWVLRRQSSVAASI